MTSFSSYLDVIKNPMDLGTMQKKLAQGNYLTMDDFAADYRLMVDNCRTFNTPRTYVTFCADVLDIEFAKEWVKATGTLQSLDHSFTLDHNMRETSIPSLIPIRPMGSRECSSSRSRSRSGSRSQTVTPRTSNILSGPSQGSPLAPSSDSGVISCYWPRRSPGPSPPHRIPSISFSSSASSLPTNTIHLARAPQAPVGPRSHPAALNAFSLHGSDHYLHEQQIAQQYQPSHRKATSLRDISFEGCYQRIPSPDLQHDLEYGFCNRGDLQSSHLEEPSHWTGRHISCRSQCGHVSSYIDL
jgi:hypothetical protein